MSKWIEIRTAYHVGRLSTVTAAADFLGIHRSTVIRHIDALESELGTKLFQRHSRGYTPTDLGLELMKVAERADDDFSSLIKLTQVKRRDLSGELIISCRELSSTLIIPLLSRFQDTYPGVKVEFNSIIETTPNDHQFPRLELGEAHISVRVGKLDEHPDYIHKFYRNVEFGLFASPAYAAKYGVPEHLDDIGDHRFVCYIPSKPVALVHTWIRDHIPKRNIVFTSSSPFALDRAMLSGMGIGLYPLHLAKAHPDLIAVWTPWPDWQAPVWAVTHVDLRNGPQVRAFLDFIDQDKRE